MKYYQKFLLWIVLLVVAAIASLYVYSTAVIVIFALLSFVMLFPKDMLRSPKILLWLFFIIVSIILLGFNLNPSGFTINSVNPPITNILPGEVLYKINDVPVTAQVLAQDYYGTVKLETSKGVKYENVNGTLGIEAEPVPPSNLKFGLDLKGGVRAVLEPNTTDNGTIDQIISTLQTRINVYGLREAVFRPIYDNGKGFVEISIAGGSKEELKNLLENQGKFEAKITINPKVFGNAGTIRLQKSHDFTVSNNSIIIDGKQLKEGESIEIEKIPFELDTVSYDKVNLTATAFTGDDVKTVFFDPQRSRIERVDSGYRWTFVIQLGQEAAQNFAFVTNNLNVVPGSGYLDSPIVLYLDNKLVDSLSISSDLKGKSETEIAISGSSSTKEIAVKDRARLQSILRSGALPTAVSVVSIDTLSPTLGTGFLKNAMLAGLAAILGVVVVVSIRYRKPKIIFPMIVISLSEILIILGVAAVIGWTIDLPAIAGIIASVGTGVDSQIMIIDQALRGEEHAATLKEKLGRAFFVIFGAGGTVIAAMLPLMVVGFGLLRGFAITTIIGVLVGILIARPAYGVIVRRLVKE